MEASATDGYETSRLSMNTKASLGVKVNRRLLLSEDLESHVQVDIFPQSETERLLVKSQEYWIWFHIFLAECFGFRLWAVGYRPFRSSGKSKQPCDGWLPLESFPNFCFSAFLWVGQWCRRMDVSIWEGDGEEIAEAGPYYKRVGRKLAAVCGSVHVRTDWEKRGWSPRILKKQQ